MTLKNIFYCFGLFSIALSQWGCGNRLDGFDIAYRQNFPREIPAGLSTIDAHIFVFDNVSSNIDTKYAVHNVTDADITKIVPRSARISARFDDADFIFVNRVFVYVYPVGEPNKKIEVFYREDVPVNTGTGINLNGGIADVKSIVGRDKYTIEVRLEVRGQPGRNIEAVFDYGFFAVTSD